MDHPENTSASPERRVRAGEDGRSGERPAYRTPRWVKLSCLAVLIAVLVAVILMLVIGGEHGPGRHSGAGRLVPDHPNGAVTQLDIAIGLRGSVDNLLAASRR